MNMVLERLDVTKNYVTIDSPIAFYIQVNDDVEHRVLKSPQAIQIDCRKLLSHFYMPNEPAWKLSIVYDKDLLSENEYVKWSAHNVDFAGSTNSVDGELVKVDLTDLYTHLQDNNTSLISKIDELSNKLNYFNLSIKMNEYPYLFIPKGSEIIVPLSGSNGEERHYFPESDCRIIIHSLPDFVIFGNGYKFDFNNSLNITNASAFNGEKITNLNISRRLIIYGYGICKNLREET